MKFSESQNLTLQNKLILFGSMKAALKMKNGFYFILKAIFVLKTFKFLS